MERNMKFLSFWSINDSVRAEPLCRQMAEMQAHGIEGVVFHPRFYPGDPNYMTSAFIQTVGEVILYAKSIGMEFWIYDENGWPSGAADGQVLAAHPDSKRWGLLCTEEKELLPEDIVLCRHNGKVVAARGVRGVGPLCRETTETFLLLTHERYLRELPAEAFDYVTGFFCDEVDYFPGHLLKEGAVPWCPDFEAVFTEKYGASPCADLWKLFDTEAEHPDFKIRFWETAGDLIARNFYQPYQDWCEAHGKLFTGHLKGEESPYFQLMFSGSCFAQMKTLSLPAVDTLERYHGNHFFPYLLASVAAQQGRRGCLAEAMGGAGWGVSPRDVENYMLWLAQAGVERIVLHLGQFLLKAQAIRDWPPSVPLHLTWHGAFAELLEKIRKEAKPLLQTAWDAPKTLIVTPTRAIMAAYRPQYAADINMHDGSGIPESASAKINADFLSLVETCYEAGNSYHFTEERELKNARLENGVLRLGEMTYEKVLLSPDCLFESDEQMLVEALRAHGMLAEVPQKTIHEIADVSEAVHFTPTQTPWQIETPKENQMLVEWQAASDGTLTAVIPTKNIDSAIEISFSDPILSLQSNAKVEALDGANQRFLLSDLDGDLMLSVTPDSKQPLPFAWIRGDFAVYAIEEWRAFGENQCSSDARFYLDGAERTLSCGELVEQGLPFFGGLLHAEKHVTLAQAYEGILQFDGLSVAAAKVSVDGKPIGWWWTGRTLSVKLSAGAHTIAIDAAPSTFNTYGPHHYYRGDFRLTSPHSYLGIGGFMDDPDAPAYTLVETMQFVRFTIDGDIVLRG